MTDPHILLISLDTVRRDHLGCYGHRRPISPNLDRIAAEGVRCADSVANCGWTLPQHMTLFTGLYPLTHGCVPVHGSPPLSPRFKTLPEHLKKHGYRTFAGVTLNRFGGGEIFGFARGFNAHAVAEARNQHMEWSERFAVEHFERHHAKGPCFVYLHIHDTHEPFQPPEPWFSMWGPSYHNQYEGEISYADYHLGRLFSALKKMGIFDRTLTVIFSDHGTEFWEHGFHEKKVNLYNEILHVPLLFRYPPALPCRRVVDGLAESADVAPTILEVAGLPPLLEAQGRSLLARFLGQSAETPQRVCSHTAHNHQRDGGPIQFDHFAIQTLSFKFIRTELRAEPDALHSDWKQRFQTLLLRVWRDPATLKAGDVIRELYDLRDDPEEQRTLIPEGEVRGPRHRRVTDEEARAIAADLEGKLDAWVEQTRRAGQEGTIAKGARGKTDNERRPKSQRRKP